MASYESSPGFPPSRLIPEQSTNKISINLASTIYDRIRDSENSSPNTNLEDFETDIENYDPLPKCDRG